MNQIYDPPNTYDFGTEFNYALWTADTRITLVNVPWNNDYRDIVKFASRKALDAYIDQRETTGVSLTTSYAKTNQPIRVGTPFNKVYRYNYIRVSNPLQPIDGDIQRNYYYFITDVRYIAPNTTEIVVQLDVWQTFGFDCTFGNSYIERGHIGIANANQFDNFGRDYLTIPEGLDTGAEYRMIEKEDYNVMGASLYNVLVASAVDLTIDAGDYNNPKLNAASGSYLNNLPSGATYYVFNSGASLSAYLSTVKDKPWVGQGILSITLIPNVVNYYPGFTFAAFGTPTLAPANAPRRIVKQMFKDWRNSLRINQHIPKEYRHLKKFFTYPYMAIEITTFNGTPIVAKPESWDDANATVVERISMVPPNQRITFHPRRYNAGSVQYSDLGDDGGEYIDFATMIQAFPTMAIINNMASAFLAQNANSLAYQTGQADWSQQKALRGNQTNYDQASSGMNLASNLGINSRNADMMQTDLQNRAIGNSAILNSITGVVGGAGAGVIGGPAGAGIGAIGGAAHGIVNNVQTMMQQGVNSESLAIRNSANSYGTGQQVGAAGYVRDTNKNLADWAAKGDYEQTIAGIQAKVRDSLLTQPTTSGQVGGETINMINNDVKLSVRWKFLDLAHVRAIGDYWLRYGYAVNRFASIPSSLQVMTKFTYWKLSETYLSAGMMPESMKQAIRGLFEKGVTVWTNPDDIGMIKLSDNLPLEGVTIG